MHGKQSFTAEMLSEGEPRELIRETFNVLNQPLKNLSVSQHIPEDLTDTLSKNVFYFSGFKTYHELNEASKRLIDDNGGIKSFEKFAEDIKAINNTYNRNYLAAEYEFASGSSQMAVKWKEIEKDGDRYDLQYRTANDGLVRPEHAALHGITLPPSDKFWEKYYPPNGWRCRCAAIQVRKGKYPVSDSATACDAGNKATTHIGKDGTNKGVIFRFNPGKQEKIFPPKHPYYKVPEKTAKEVESVVDTLVKKNNVSLERKRLSSSNEMPTAKNHTEQPNLTTNAILKSGKVLERFLSHCKSIEELDAAKYIWNNPGDMVFVRHSPFGEGKDLTSTKDLKNLAKKQKRGVVGYNVYEFSYNGQTWKLKLEVHKKGFEQFYTMCK